MYNEYLKDLQEFVHSRVGDRVKLDIPRHYIGQDHSPHTLVVEDLGKVAELQPLHQQLQALFT